LIQCGGSDSGPDPFPGACTIADDVDGDGTADFLTALAYDARDRLVAQSIDHDRDGAADSVAAFAYGADGDLDGIDVDLDGDGDVEVEDIPPGEDSPLVPIRVTRDARGREVSRSFDVDVDERVDVLAMLQYDRIGNRVLASIDYGNDGLVDIETRYEYDAAANLLAIAEDANADGIADRSIVNGYECW
jgi:hypothetical protein